MKPIIKETQTTLAKKDATTVNETVIKKQSDDMTKLHKLKELYDLGIITEVEYTDRKSQIIDEMTGTKSSRYAKGRPKSNFFFLLFTLPFYFKKIKNKNLIHFFNKTHFIH